MIGRRMVVAVAGGAFVLLGAQAQVRAELPPAVRTATPADSYKDSIDKYVAELAARVQAGDAKSGAARDELCRQVETTAGGVTPSASFQTLYVSSAMASLKPLLADKSVMVRLNAAIMVSRLCTSTTFPQLSPLAIAAMGDQSAAVSLWGLKAAGALLPQVLATPLNAGNQKLTPAIVAAVAAHHDVSAVVQEAYIALSLPDQTPPLPAAAMDTCAAAVCDVIDARLKDYTAGLPVNPQADRSAALFLIRGTVLSALTPPHRVKAVQSLSDLLIASARRAAVTPAGDPRDDLYLVVTSSAGWLYSILNGTPPAARYAELLKVPGTMKGDEIVQKAVAALTDVNQLPDYKGIKPLAN